VLQDQNDFSNIKYSNGFGTVTLQYVIDGINTRIDNIKIPADTTHQVLALDQRVGRLEYQVGEIDTALDNIIALQQSYIGGAAV
jgi:hypothetical protein